MKIFVLCFLLGFSHLSHAQIKNIYILLDPVSQDDSDLTYTSSSLYVINAIVSGFKKLKLNKIIVHVTGMEDDRQILLTKKNIDDFNIRDFSSAVFGYINQSDSKISTYLSSYSFYLKRNNIQGDETLFIVFSDMNYKNSKEYIGGYLNSYFLIHKRSPFVKKFLDTNLMPISNSSVVVFTRSKLDLNLEKGRKKFINNLFIKADKNIKMFYIGETQNNVNSSNTDFAFNLVLKIVSDNLSTISTNNLKPTSKAQIIKKNGVENVNL